MNWTGGRLNRHAKSNIKSTLKAQKQHFAKVSLNNLVAARSEASSRSICSATKDLRASQVQDPPTVNKHVRGRHLHEAYQFGTFCAI